MRNDRTVTPEVLETSHARLETVREALGLLRTNATQMAYLTRIAVETRRAEAQRRSVEVEATAVVEREEARVASAQDAARVAHEAQVADVVISPAAEQTEQPVVVTELRAEPVVAGDSSVDQLAAARAVVEEASRGAGIDTAMLDARAASMDGDNAPSRVANRAATGTADDDLERLMAQLNASRATASEVANA